MARRGKWHLAVLFFPSFQFFLPQSLWAESPDAANVVYKQISSIPRSLAYPFVIDGTSPGDPNDWKATLFVKLGTVSCTATIISASVILTAAHCLEAGPVMGFQLADVDYKADCEASRQYKTDKSADYALCLARSPMVGVPLQRLALDPNELQRSKSVVLAGYGCARYPAPVYFGFQIGKSDIWKLPGSIGGQPNAIQVRGGSALCLGDSGGGAYIVKQPSQSRRLAAINAQMDEEPIDGIRTSTLASVSTPDFLDFATKWLCKNKSKAAIPGIIVDQKCVTEP